ncbi:MAG: hypothetical protein E5W90_06110 [Mesorhizobium sp.]|nr:MAG: hypothetical protein E5W90_06110 [Mesorhizobium sp.]
MAEKPPNERAEAAALAPVAEEIIAGVTAVEASRGAASEGNLAELFTRLKIVKVVLVDDKIEQEMDPSVIVEVITTHAESRAYLSDWFSSIELDPQNEALFEQVSAKFSDFSQDELNSLRDGIGKVAPEIFEKGAFDQLRFLLPRQIEMEFLMPSIWNDMRSALLAECDKDRRTLFLFDQELGNNDALPFSKGSDIIKDLALTDKEAFGTKWFCGMLSHTLQPGDEVDTWLKLEQEEDIKLSFFMPIAKGSLNELPKFYGAIYRTLINTYCASMKDLAKGAFKEALEAALDRFSKLDPIDFEHMVLKSSEEEGVSELETLIRLYGIFHKDQVKAQILKEATLQEFSTAATGVKIVADFARKLPQMAQERLAKLRQTELYEEEALVNGFHDPLRNGDVFEIGEGDSIKLWVLIAQPCDLMVRSDGERAREDNFKVAVLAPVRTMPTNGDLQKPGLSFRLDHFDKDGTGNSYVDFAEATSVNLRVLDLVVLSKSGKCEIGPVKDLDPKLLLPTKPWMGRAVILAKHFEKVTNEIEKARRKFKDDGARMLETAMLPRLSYARKLTRHGSYDKGKFIYPIRRVTRIRDPLAASLLAAFSQYFSRDAYDHDFSKAAVSKVDAA